MNRRKLKNKIFSKTVILILSVILFSFVSCSKKENHAETFYEDISLKQVLERNRLVVGIDPSFPPMTFIDEQGNYAGYDIDLVKEVTFRMGVDLEFKVIKWNEKEEQISSGQIDCIWSGLTMTEERMEFMTFTKPYINNYQVILVHADEPFTEIKDLNGKTLSYQTGSSAEDALQADPDLMKILKQTIPFVENESSWNALKNREIDGIAIDSVFANYMMAANQNEYKVLNNILMSEQYAVAFKKGSLALRDAVQKKMNDMEVDGTVDRIADRWFGQNHSVINKTY